jgi:hypothetical protein
MIPDTWLGDVRATGCEPATRAAHAARGRRYYISAMTLARWLGSDERSL